MAHRPIWSVSPAIAILTVVLCGLQARAEDSMGPIAVEATVAENAVVTPSGVVARVTRGPMGLGVEGRFRVAASNDVAWAVLTDYDGIDRFVSSMRESRVAERREDYLTVEQEAVGRLLFFKRRLHTVLRVQEEPPGRIRFADVLHKDFQRYDGEWRIQERGREVEIVYRLEASPNVTIPDFVARRMFEGMVRRLLLEVEKEILRREAVAEHILVEGAR